MEIPKLIDRIRECKKLLQVALDFVDMEKALRLATKIPRENNMILEAGTPLIKSFGISSVRFLRSISGNHLVFADMKIMDVGALEAKLAFSNGADGVSVSALTNVETIQETVEEAEKWNGAVYADLIGIDGNAENLRLTIEKLKNAKVHVALFHTGIDVQVKQGITAGKSLEIIKELKELFNGKIAVAGGIKPEEVSSFAEAGADIIIIGGGITKAEDPNLAASKAREGLGSDCL
ncbi:MAG: orotidine 5'-phosphate decarboxylase [Caldisphaeraceae archaeon]|nr:orotidine 5'-phosphate decarboxylase [Caldisphaeraceae archaeon]MEB3797672.1 orotidine 5'-phosphate decarboxylase [Caldisphaeraceae archaeon]